MEISFESKHKTSDNSHFAQRKFQSTWCSLWHITCGKFMESRGSLSGILSIGFTLLLKNTGPANHKIETMTAIAPGLLDFGILRLYRRLKMIISYAFVWFHNAVCSSQGEAKDKV